MPSYFNNKVHNDRLSYKDLCYKTATLLIILGANRKTAFLAFSIDEIKTDGTKCVMS